MSVNTQESTQSRLITEQGAGLVLFNVKNLSKEKIQHDRDEQNLGELPMDIEEPFPRCSNPVAEWLESDDRDFDELLFKISKHNAPEDIITNQIIPGMSSPTEIPIQDIQNTSRIILALPVRSAGMAVRGNVYPALPTHKRRSTKTMRLNRALAVNHIPNRQLRLADTSLNMVDQAEHIQFFFRCSNSLKNNVPLPTLRILPLDSAQSSGFLKRKYVEDLDEDLDGDSMLLQHRDARKRVNSDTTPSLQKLLDLCALYSQGLGGCIDVASVLARLLFQGYRFSSREQKMKLAQSLQQICIVHKHELTGDIRLRLRPSLDWRLAEHKQMLDAIAAKEHFTNSCGVTMRQVADWYFKYNTTLPTFDMCMSYFGKKLSSKFDDVVKFFKDLHAYFFFIPQSNDEDAECDMIPKSSSDSTVPKSTIKQACISYKLPVREFVPWTCPANQLAGTTIVPKGLNDSLLLNYITRLLRANEDGVVPSNFLFANAREIQRDITRSSVSQFVSQAAFMQNGLGPSWEQVCEQFITVTDPIAQHSAQRTLQRFLAETCAHVSDLAFEPRRGLTEHHLQHLGQFLPEFTSNNLFDFLISQGQATAHNCIRYFAPRDEREGKTLRDLMLQVCDFVSAPLSSHKNGERILVPKESYFYEYHRSLGDHVGQPYSYSQAVAKMTLDFNARGKTTIKNPVSRERVQESSRLEYLRLHGPKQVFWKEDYIHIYQRATRRDPRRSSPLRREIVG